MKKWERYKNRKKKHKEIKKDQARANDEAVSPTMD